MGRVSIEIEFMADIQTPSKNQGRKAGISTAKKLSTKVDLTPMVDLGFLLITFFVFTTSLTQPSALNIIIPADGTGTVTPENKTLNLVLAPDNKIHYYIGNEVGNQGCTDFSPNGVRQVIRFMQRTVAKKFGNKDETVILIRPANESSYMNLVDILDEILIANIKKYALMDPADKGIMQPSNLKQPC
jgi:biopolymer transport protein ExbD